MEAEIEAQLLALEELSEDLDAANLTVQEEPVGEAFVDVVHKQLLKMISFLENDDESSVIRILENEDFNDDDIQHDDALKIFENIKHNLISLGFKAENEEGNVDDEDAEFDKIHQLMDKQAVAVKKEAARAIEVKKEKSKLVTLFLCPFDGCDFSTDKEGMRTNRAALHMKIAHKIKAVDMKPGMYKFKKLKYEL